MNIFLGCDVAKLKVDVALVDECSVEQWGFEVPNEAPDLAEMLLNVVGAYPDDDLCVIVESTACYHHPLLEAANATGVPVRLMNPILTKQLIKSSIRGKKTDRTDAVAIARLGLRGEGRVFAPEPYMTTKYTIRAQQQLGTFATSLRLYQIHIENVLGEELSPKAKESLTEIHKQIKIARKQFIADTTASAPSGLMKRLQTIPGVGPYVAASLIGEIQSMDRFKSIKELVAYAGLDPKIRQSGSSLNNTGKLTKRGSSHLRHSLFISANVSRQHDPNMKALYDKKRGEGKCYTVATIVVSRKLLAVVRAVWLSEKDYDVNFAHGAQE